MNDLEAVDLTEEKFLALYDKHMSDPITMESISNPVRDLDPAGQHCWELQSILQSIDCIPKSPLTKNALEKTHLRPDWDAVTLSAIREFLEIEGESAESES